ncbi:MAG: TlpA disulfide reductase family protein [Sulfurovaceae bacterium]|nr:TlpA disulfide reductase family protein [Sulfurovaceae bacterium]
MKKILMFMVSLLVLSVLTQAKQNTNFTFTDTNGKVFHVQGTKEGLIINELKNKIVFLEFFGHKCPPCLASIPHYKNLQTKYKNNIAIISMEVQGFDNAQLKAFAKTNGINYSTVSQEKAGYFVNYIAGRANWTGAIPFLVVVDKKGVVQYIQVGMISEAGLESIIKELSK